MIREPAEGTLLTLPSAADSTFEKSGTSIGSSWMSPAALASTAPALRGLPAAARA
jgi:hypothetical protein